MKTLSDFKRRLTLGTEVTTTYFRRMMVRGNTGTTIFEIPPPNTRIVGKVQTNSVAFKRPDKEELSWLTFPKAGDIKFPDANTADIFQGGEKILSYKFS
jgi:hypothetical protein